MAKKSNLLKTATATPAAGRIVEESTKEKAVRINVAVPKALHDAFRRKAFDNGETHQAILLDAIRRYVES